MNTDQSFHAKMEFVKAKFPNYMEINPYMDLKAIDQIKHALYENGFTKVTPNITPDSVVTNLLKRIQNWNMPNYHVKKPEKKYFVRKTREKAG